MAQKPSKIVEIVETEETQKHIDSKIWAKITSGILVNIFSQRGSANTAVSQ